MFKVLKLISNVMLKFTFLIEIKCYYSINKNFFFKLTFMKFKITNLNKIHYLETNNNFFVDIRYLKN